MNPALPNSRYYVYLLKSDKIPAIYIGCTNDLERRLKEHTAGKVYSTKKMLPVELIYYEAYPFKDWAYEREKSLKTYGSGLAKLKLRLRLTSGGRAG